MNDMDNIKEIDKLFLELHRTMYLRNIALHGVKNGGLDPMFIMETEVLNLAQWREAHGKLKVKVQGDPVLERVVRGEIVVINDVEKDENSSPAFVKFGIKSVAVFPLFDENKELVIALIVIPAFQNKIQFDIKNIEKCKVLIEEFNKHFDKI